MKHFFSLFIYFACAWFYPLLGQSSSAYFKALTSENGLTENHVNSIYQDKAGFMWFGTFDGLNRYDGYTITTYKPDLNDSASISSILIYAITGDETGNLWVGTTGAGLNHYDAATEKFTRLRADLSRPGSLNSDNIQSIFVDSRQRLWVGSDRGVSMMELSGWTPDQPTNFRHFLPSENGSNYRVSDMYEDKKGQLFFGTNRGLFLLPTDTSGKLVSIDKRVDNSPTTSIEAVIELPSGDLLLGGPDGVWIRANGTREFLRFNSNPTNTLALDAIGKNLWVGTRQGLLRYNLSGDKVELQASYSNNPSNPLSLRNNTIEHLYTDKNGLIWIGTFGGGVSYYDPQQKDFGVLQANDNGPGLTNNSVRSIVQDKAGRVWIGTVGGGVNVTNGPLGRKEDLNIRQIDTPARVYAIMEVNKGNDHFVYLGTDNQPGLYRVDLNRPSWPVEPINQIKAAVFAMHQDRNNVLWFGTYSGGVHRWVPDDAMPGGYRSTVFQAGNGENDLPSNIIRSIAEDQNGDIWIGTGAGLVRIDASETVSPKPTFTTYRNVAGDNNSLSHNYVLSLKVAADNSIWVGTFGGGLNHLTFARDHDSPSFEQFTEADGFPNGVIKAILIDDQQKIWASTNKGIVCLDPATGQLKTLDYGDGLQSSEFQELAACRQQDGIFVFGGVNGINFFDPSSIGTDKTSVRPILTRLEIDNVHVTPGSEVNNRQIITKALNRTEGIQLKHFENSISLEFSALQYNSPEDNDYAYKLEGFDEDWIYTSANQRRATYTNLPYRDYIFHVKASNSDGVWSDDTSSLAISVSPPFWLTWYAWLIYALLIGVLLYAFRKFSLIDAKEKNRLTIEQVSREKIREVNRLKLQFFTNISHELRTPLTLITGPLENLIQSSASMTGDQRRDYLHLMYKNAKYLLRLVDQLLDFRKLDQGAMPMQLEKIDITAFLREIISPFNFLAGKKDINLRLIAEEEPLTVWFDTTIIEKIVYNLLSNAFKFTPPGGEITLRIGKDSKGSPALSEPFGRYGAFAISVEDNGPGIPKKQHKLLFDRFYKSAVGEVTNKDGAGIGLAFTRDLVDLHRGTINVKSKVGEGSKFTVRLSLDKDHYERDEFMANSGRQFVPRYDPEDFIGTDSASDAEELTHNQMIRDAQHTNQLLSERDDSPLLLYIDDNADLRNFIRQGMESDFRVIAADGGGAGIEIATTAVPDIIITDLMMPDIDGYAVLKSLKNDPRTSHIPIIMLTAKDTLESETEGLDYGADGYLTKPFNIGNLKQRIKNILSSRNQLRDRFRKEVITSPSEVTLTNVDEEFLQRAVDLVEENMDNTEFTVEELVRLMQVSRSRLYLKLKALTGQSSSEFIRTVRLKRAVQLLENTGYTVKEVMFMTGFNTASYFSKCFKQQFGILPSEYIKLHKKKQLENKE